MTKAQKYKAMFLIDYGEVWGKKFEDIYEKCQADSFLILHDCEVSLHSPDLTKYITCEAIFLLVDGSYIIFKTWEEITTCTALKKQGFSMGCIELIDTISSSLSSVIVCENLSKLLKGE
jgi:hypothetical protein